jgi:O-antigen biosynthesis protein
VVDVGDYHFSKNNNKLAKQAKFNKVVFMNNDVFINENIFEKMSSLLKKKVGVVGTKLLYENGTIQHGGIEMIQSKVRNPHKYYLPEHIDHEKKDYKKENEIVDSVTGACLMMPTALFNEYNGFGEEYDKVFQDVDLCLKINKQGFKTMCCNEISAIHLESATRDPEINNHDYDIMVDRWGKVKY